MGTKSGKEKRLSGKECEVMNYVQYFKEPIIDIIKRYSTIKKYAFILHDKDYNEKGVLESPHYHIYLNFGRATVPFDMVARWFGVEPQYVQKVHKTGSLLEYLTHSNESQKFKHQYSPEEVTANFDFVKEAEIENMLGDFTKYSYAQQLMYVNSLSQDKRIPAFNQLQKFWKLECEVRTLQSDRDIEVVFICGKGGTGKTYYAKKLLEQMGYDYCVSSSSNDMWQDYKGQWAMILDDVRDSSMPFADMLKMIDNNTSSSVASRYANKVFNGKLMVLTSSIPPKFWYRSVQRDGGRNFIVSDEDLNQFYRRITCYIYMTDKHITIYNEGLDNLGNPKGLGQVLVNEVAQIKQEKRERTDFGGIFSKFCSQDTESPF